jgi:RNA recognition motif-containing protein
MFIVQYATPRDASNAIATLNDAEFMGRKIFVREDREAKGAVAFSAGAETVRRTAVSAEGVKVYVGNLSFDVVWQVFYVF